MSDRSINQIFIACQEQNPCTEEELRLTILSLGYMLQVTERQLYELAELVKEKSPMAGLKASFALNEREPRFKSHKMPPSKYLGKNYTPGTAENNAIRKWANGIYKQVTGEDLAP